MLHIHNLTFRHPQSSKNLFRSFDLVFNNEITSIVGKNGVGKTSLFEIITDSFVEFTTGKSSLIEFESGTNLEIINQKPDLSILPWYNSVQFLEIISKIKKQKPDLVWYKYNLELFGIDPKAKLSNLSGGQKQIVNILKALALKPSLLLLDEPFSALDIENCIKLKKIILDWQAQNQICVILVSHSLIDVLELADRVVILGNNPVEIIYDLDKILIGAEGKSIINNYFES
jgi:ABC-type nitrate/sulfonate/bicarbonate transport system ATPase subunit